MEISVLAATDYGRIYVCYGYGDDYVSVYVSIGLWRRVWLMLLNNIHIMVINAC